MKMCIDENEMFIYLTKIYLKNNFNFNLEEYFKQLFLKLKSYYGINVSGYYLINVYQNKNYGYIIHIVREEFEYLDYLEDQVDMKIQIHQEVPIFYELKDSDLKILSPYLDYFLFKKKIYGKPKQELTTFQLSQILEMSEDVFYDENEIIENYGKEMLAVD